MAVLLLKLRPRLGRLAVLAAVLLLSACSGLFLYPQRPLLRTPADLGLRYDEVRFPSGDGTPLHGWYLHAQGRPKGSIHYLHGNAENISTHIGFVAWLPKQGYNVFLWDYRGYGESGGASSVAGLNADARAALRYQLARGGDDAQRLVVFGQSLGGAVAIRTVAAAADKLPVRALISEGAFSSYRRIAREKMALLWLTRYLRGLLQYLFSDRYSPVQVAAQIAPIPFLIIHGEADPVVPIHHAERLQAASAGHAELWRIAGGRHVDATTRPEYRARLLEYLERVLGPAA